MNNFQKEFLMNMFLDSDHVSTSNRLVVAVANIVNENCENMIMFNNVIKQECKQSSLADNGQRLGSLPLNRPVKRFYEQTILNFTDEDYITQFKMRKSTVLALVNFLKNHASPASISLEKKVHVFLWVLLYDCSYNEIGKLFDLHKSSVSFIFHEIATILNEHIYQFISWPSKEEQHFTRIKVNSRFKFPNCVGFIDACRFKVVSKKNTQPDNVLLQAVCDETLMFIDIYISPLGRTKKNKVFKDSHLSNELKKLVEFENHIIGDSEYRLRKNLITPFTSEELLTSEEMKFNEIHWKTRSYIGHAFELLKEKFRKLNHIDIVKPESVHLLISVSCILHNFILMHEGCSEVKEEAVSFDDGVTINTSIVQTAEEKRQFLCNYMNFIDTEDLLT